MVGKEKSDDQFSDKEAAARRDAVIKRMIAMPPKPHSEMKMGKSPGGKGKTKKAASPMSKKKKTNRRAR